MPILRSRRSPRHVVFHCPACFADRVGLVKTGRWNEWPGGRPRRGPHFECTGCGSRIFPCAVMNSPTATAFSTRLIAGTRSLIASVVSAGPRERAVIDAAIDAVETLTPVPYPRERLDEDVAAPDLAVRLRGDLILLAEQLRPHGCEAILSRASLLASMEGGPTAEQRSVIRAAASYLGCPGFDPGWPKS